MHSLVHNLKWYLLVGLVGLNMFIWYAVVREERADILVVAFLDVGQGDAIFIESPSGGQMLIDGGAGRGALRALSEVMPFYDRSLDVVIATHPDQDHIGGLSEIIRRYEVETILRSGVASDTGAYRALSAAIAERGVTEVLARRGMRLHLGSGVYVDILFPDRDVSGVDANSASIVARLVYGDIEFMLTGDAPQSIERYLVSLEGSSLESDVLKVGHHGSRTSSAESFVGFVSPEYAIISSGRDNRYGHPHQEVLDLFELLEVEVVQTSEKGTIVFETDGHTLRLR